MSLDPKLILNPKEPCFICNKQFKVLEYYLCGNGESEGYCRACLGEKLLARQRKELQDIIHGTWENKAAKKKAIHEMAIRHVNEMSNLIHRFTHFEIYGKDKK